MSAVDIVTLDEFVDWQMGPLDDLYEQSTPMSREVRSLRRGRPGEPSPQLFTRDRGEARKHIVRAAEGGDDVYYGAQPRWMARGDEKGVIDDRAPVRRRRLRHDGALATATARRRRCGAQRDHRAGDRADVVGGDGRRIPAGVGVGGSDRHTHFGRRPATDRRATTGTADHRSGPALAVNHSGCTGKPCAFSKRCYSLNMLDREPLSVMEARALISRIIVDGSTVFTRHARERMAERKLIAPDVINVLRGGVVDPPESSDGSWRYAVRTNRIRVVVAFASEQELRVISAWRLEK